MYKQGKKETIDLARMRGNYPREPRWYCVMTHCGKEQKAGESILNACPAISELDVLLPILNAAAGDGQEPGSRARFLFNGYLFVRCRMSDEIYVGICACKSVYSILGHAYRVPLIIDDQEMATFQLLLKYEPGPILAHWPGNHAKAVVTGGTLEGLEGRLFEPHDECPAIAFQLSFPLADHGIVVRVPRSQVSIE